MAACIEAALRDVTVRYHDDGSRPAMHDLELSRGGVTFAACEVTAAADAESIELWNLANGHGRWIEPDLLGGWMVTLAPSYRAKRLQALAPDILRQLESDASDSAAISALRKVGVLDAHRSGTDFPGCIYSTIERDPIFTGGMVGDRGDALVAWLNDWIKSPAQAHNLQKLASAGRAECHLAILLPGFSSAPFDAADLLLRDDGPLPTSAPTLPSPITQV